LGKRGGDSSRRFFRSAHKREKKAVIGKRGDGKRSAINDPKEKGFSGRGES